MQGNPILTGSGGTYGGPGSYTAKLVVQGTISEGTPIEFYVNGARADVQDVKSGSGWAATFPFHSTGVTELNLRVATLPGTTVTTSPTTNTTTAATTTQTTTVTATATTYYSSGGGGGGGGGGGSGYSGAIASGTTKTTTIPTTQAPAATTTVTEEQTIPITTEPATEMQTEIITSVPTTVPPPPGTGLPPLNQLILYGAGALVLITVISLAVVGKYEGWWGRKPPQEP